MAKVRRVVRAVRGVIDWLTLPFDMQTLWHFFWRWIAPALPGLVSVVLGYLYHAPYWQIALLAAGFFALFYLGVFGVVVLRRRALVGVHTDTPTRSARTARAVSTQSEAVGEASPETATREWWRERIKEWWSVIPDYDLDRQDDRQRFLRTDTYSQMRPHLRPEVVEMFEAQRTLHVGNEARGDTAYGYTLLDEVARIENERVLNAPEPITNQAASGELKSRCIELADELSAFLDRWENYRHQEKILPEEPWEWPRYTMERYRETLEPRLVNLLDDLEQSKWITAETRTHLPLPTDDPQKIREIAARLRGICCRH